MRRIRGRRNVEEQCADLLNDESNCRGAWCLEAAWPETVSEAAGYLRECASGKLPVTLSGGLTGVAAGALPDGGAVLSASGFRHLSLTPDGLVEAGAGIAISELRSFLSSASPGRFYPPDPTEESASVGGTVSTDASGSDSYLYGSTRSWVRKLELVLPGGRPLLLERGRYGFGKDGSCSHPELGRLQLPTLDRTQPPKNSAGYFIRPGMDLIDLFIGAEGTLGLVSTVWLETAPRPAHTVDLALFPYSWDCFWELFRAVTAPDVPLRVRAVEMMDERCLAFIAGHAEELPPTPSDAAFSLLLRIEATDDGGLDASLAYLEDLLDRTGVDPDTVWGGFESSEQERIRSFRHALPESINREVARARLGCPDIHKLGSDGAVPPGNLEGYYRAVRGILESGETPFAIFGHAGQGHLHANAIPVDGEGLRRGERAMVEIAKLSVGMGGTLSAEHGLGRLKAGFLPLMYSREELQGMEKLRRSIDPCGLLMPAVPIGGPV
jgi:D-lactate dehydrogenase (cytochrome)